MSGSAKAGTTAERHTCELRVLIASIVRAPPKRASGESFSPLTKDLHGGRQSGSYLSVPSSLMAIGLDIRRLAKEDFMSFSVLHGIGSEVIPGQLAVTPASQADVGA